jgi:HlyD family secretion protein
VKHPLTILIFVAVIAVGIYFYWSMQQRVAADEALFIATELTATEEVPFSASAANPDHVFIAGVVVPERAATLTAQTAGRIDEILVREGDQVEENQVLIRLGNEEQKVAVAQAEAGLRAAQAELDKLKAGARPQEIEAAEAAVEIAQANLTKISEESQNLNVPSLDKEVSKTIAEAELRRAQADLELLQSGSREEDLAIAEATVAEAEASLQQQQLALAATELRAPFAGTIASMDLEVGETIAQGATIAQLADFTNWMIKSDELDELSVVNVNPGDEARIAFDAIPGLELTGTLEHIRPIGNYDEGDVTYSTIIVPTERDPRVRWNMTAQIIFNTEE